MKIRILMIGPLPPPVSGPEMMNAILIRHLAQRPDVAFLHIDTQVSRSLSDKGQRQIGKALFSVKHIVEFLRGLISFRPDVAYIPLTNSVSFNGFLRDTVFIMLARFFGTAVVVHLHAGYCRYMRHNGWKRRLVASSLGQVAGVIVLGENLRQVFDDLVPPDRVYVVPNGVDDDSPLAASNRRETDRTRAIEPLRVLFVGWLHPDKGVTDILHAAPLVPDVTFNLVGDWASNEHRAHALAIVNKCALQDRVSFPGVLTGADKSEAFASADVFVFPTYYEIEGHPVVVVEAMAAGLPIICTDHGALSETVKDSWNGYLVPRQEPAVLAERLNALRLNPALRHQMGQRSRQLYEERYTAEHYVRRWLEVMFACKAAAETSPGAQEGKQDIIHP